MFVSFQNVKWHLIGPHLIGPQAEEFHGTAHKLLEWLAGAERSLRYHGNTVPDTEELLIQQLADHKVSRFNCRQLKLLHLKLHEINYVNLVNLFVFLQRNIRITVCDFSEIRRRAVIQRSDIGGLHEVGAGHRSAGTLRCHYDASALAKHPADEMERGKRTRCPARQKVGRWT